MLHSRILKTPGRNFRSRIPNIDSRSCARRRYCQNGGINKTLKSPSETKVVMALSGGVDSAVSAYLLKEQGFQVSGIYMRNWSEADEAYCSGQDDLEQVDRVCHFLGIPYKVVDFQKEYWNHVFEPMLNAYQDGVTPNPDVLCNKEIKFKALFDFVFSRTPSPDYLATGHYAQLRPSTSISGYVDLCEAADRNKDQTYFLLQVEQRALQRVLFPIGHLTKPQVRDIAVNAKLPNAARRESMGLCFVGKRKFDTFLGEFTQRPGSQPGAILDIDSRSPVGVHKGSMFYTVGQAANISGAPARMFVAEKDPERNAIIVCQGSHHPALYKDSLRASGFNWIQGYLPPELLDVSNGVLNCVARIRHRQDLQSCQVKLSPSKKNLMDAKKEKKESEYTRNKKASSPSSASDQSTSNTLPSEIDVIFDLPRRAITEGQYIGLYKDGICLGGGIITATGPNYHELGKKVLVFEKSNSFKRSETQEQL